MGSDLTTTSHAILGLLATRSWTTYELAQQMGRALGSFWPRAESKIYEEPKKLAQRGLAKAVTENVGQRSRTVYSITAKGRRALAGWVPTPSAPPSLEHEALVKVFFAEHGSKDDLLRTIDGVREWCDARVEPGLAIAREYLDGHGRFPERLPWLILAGRFLYEYELAARRWADWASAVVEEWPDDVRAAEPSWDALREAADTYESLLRRRPRTAPSR